MEAARPDVLGALVHQSCDARQLGDRLVAEDERHVLGREQRGVLPDEDVLGLGQDADDVGLRERVEPDADREAAVSLRTLLLDPPGERFKLNDERTEALLDALPSAVLVGGKAANDCVAGRCVRPRKAANIRYRSMTSCIEAQEPAESAVHPVEQARGNGSGKGVEIFFVYGRDLGGVGDRVSRQAGCTPG